MIFKSLLWILISCLNNYEEVLIRQGYKRFRYFNELETAMPTIRILLEILIL